MIVTATRLVPVRRLVQAASVFLLGYILWNTRYPLSGYLNPEIYFLADPYAMIITSVAERVLLPGLIYASILLIITLFLGRAFCGWICPLGATLDFFSYLRMLALKIFRIKEKEPDPTPLRYGKYLVLAATLIAALAGTQLAWFLDPITIFVRAFSFTLHPLISGSIDGALRSLLAASGYPGWLESLYDYLREGFLSLSTPVFTHAGTISALFIAILALSLARRRAWCRYLCPLGATLALPGKASLLRRDATPCVKNCGVCGNLCRMNAIRKDNSYIREECVLCLDCVAFCPGEKATFSFKRRRADAAGENGGKLMTRGGFIAMAGCALAASPLAASLAAEKPGTGKKPPRPGTLSRLRPPGALPEEEFIRRCIRCGNCMKVCPTNVLQPLPFMEGPGSAWTPALDTRRGYCEYRCSLCGRVCPTDAIRELPLATKQKEKIGIAVFNRKICIPHAKGDNCIVCEEHCPIPEKAIRVRDGIVKGKKVKLPYVVADLCIGCAICELKCPTAPDKGIVTVKVRKA